MSFSSRMRGVRIPYSLLRLLISAAFVVFALAASAAENPRIAVNDYAIDADLAPKTHHITAKAKVKFTALHDISTAVFELNTALRVTRVSTEAGKVLPTGGVTQDYTLRVSLPDGMSKGQSQTLNFDDEGVLAAGDDSPVEGVKR